MGLFPDPKLDLLRKNVYTFCLAWVSEAEVLMLSDHLDEPCIQKLADYEGKKFVSIQKADVSLQLMEA